MEIEHGIITKNYFSKSSSDRKNTLIYGYASVFENPDLDNDIVAKGAFKNLDPTKIKFLWQHDHSKPIGKILSATSDSYGLKIEAEINNSSIFGAEASTLIKQKAVEGLSIGFKTKSCDYDDDGYRIIDDIDLFEISIVTFPANNMAQIHDFKTSKLSKDKNLINAKNLKELEQPHELKQSQKSQGLQEPQEPQEFKDSQEFQYNHQNITGKTNMSIETKMHPNSHIKTQASKIDNLEEKLRSIEGLLSHSSYNQEFSALNALSEKGYSNNINDKAMENFLRKGVLPVGAEYKSFSTHVDEAGSVIKPELNKKILSFMQAKSPMRNLASIDNVSSSSIDYVIEDGKVASGWVKEAAARNDTDTSKLVKHSISTHELYAQPKATQKLLDDSEIDVESWIAERIANSFAASENEAFISGDGDDKPFGLLLSDKIKAEKAGTDFKADALLHMISQLPEQYLPGASFLMNRVTLSKIQSLVDETGRFIWQHSLSDPLKQTIFGIPVICVSEIPAIGDGKTHIVLGDIASTYKIIDRSNISIMRDPYTEKPFVKFYATKRTGGDVINPDACRFLTIAD